MKASLARQPRELCPSSCLELLSDSTPSGLVSVVRTKVVSGKNRKRAIASTPVNIAVIYEN